MDIRKQISVLTGLFAAPKKILFSVVVALAMVNSSKAETSGKPETAHPSQIVLKEIVIWLSTNFDLPRIFMHPNIEIVPRAEIAALLYKGFVWVAPRDIVSENQRGPPLDTSGVVAVYDDEMKTIYLREGWTGATPAERSILVHQMVHHLQNLGKLKYECPPAREALAYAAQDKWLALSELNLVDEFELDPFMLAVGTRCIY
jgi:hypothetical protein